MIDPGVADRRSNVQVFLKHFWNELENKFANLSDAFRQFNITKNKHVNFAEFNYILDTLAIRFSKEQTKQMFDHMDGDSDGKLTYQDFVNVGESVRSGEEISTISSITGSRNSAFDPFILMAKDVEQRKEFDMMEWNDEI